MESKSLTVMLTALCLLTSAGAPLAQAAELPVVAASTSITDPETQQLVTQAQDIAGNLTSADRQEISRRLPPKSFLTMEQKDMAAELNLDISSGQVVPALQNGQQTKIQSCGDLQALMQESIAKGLQMISSTNGSIPSVRAFDTNIETRKAAVFSACLEDTDEFQTSIYQPAAAPPPPVEITRVEGSNIYITVNRETLEGNLILAGYDSDQRMLAAVVHRLIGTEDGTFPLKSSEIASADIRRVFVVDDSLTPIN